MQARPAVSGRPGPPKVTNTGALPEALAGPVVQKWWERMHAWPQGPCRAAPGGGRTPWPEGAWEPSLDLGRASGAVPTGSIRLHGPRSAGQGLSSPRPRVPTRGN